MFLETCVDEILMSSRTPIVMIFVYFPLIFINLGNYVGVVRFEEEKYGKPYLDAYLAFVILGTAAFLFPVAINWVWAARFCHDGKQRETKLLFGILLMFIFHDCPFFFMEMVSMLMLNSPEFNQRSTFENFNFGMSILAFGISFTPAWLFWAKSASECVEKQLCRQPGEKFSFEHESMMEVAGETTDDAVMMAWRRRILLMYSTPNSRHGSLSPVATTMRQQQQLSAQQQQRGKSQRYYQKDEDPYSPISRSGKKLTRKKESPPGSVVYPPKELFACSRSFQKRNRKKKMKKKKILAKKTVKKKNDDGEEIETEIEEEVEVEVTDSDQSSPSSSDHSRSPSPVDVDAVARGQNSRTDYDDGGIFPSLSMFGKKPKTNNNIVSTPEIIVDSLSTPGTKNNRFTTSSASAAKKWKVYEYDDEENSIVTPPNLHVKKNLFTAAGNTNVPESKAAFAVAMADPKSPISLAHAKNDDGDGWGVARRSPPHESRSQSKKTAKNRNSKKKDGSDEEDEEERNGDTAPTARTDAEEEEDDPFRRG